jgi:hypothetical protein
MWHLHVYMYYHPSDPLSLISPLYLIVIIIVITTGLKILYSFFYRKYITILTFLTSFFYPPSPISNFPLVTSDLVSCFS